MPDINALIERWQAGDERAAEAIYNHCRDRTFRLAYGLLGNPSDAEEAAQHALAYALTHIKRFDPARASFNTWLHTITVSRCRDRQRRKRLPIWTVFDWQRGEDDPVDPALTRERHASQEEVRSQVWHAIQALSLPLREAIVLRYWAGHTYREMADILGCPVPTAQSRVRLAYERLRSGLAAVDLTALEEEQAR